MFKFYFLLFLSLFILPGCNSVKQKNLIESPILNLSEKQNPYLKDFGIVKAGDLVKHSFVIKNNSDRVLNIKDVSTSCGCTVSEVKNKILKPGESALVDVKFDSKGYSGAIEQFVYVRTDSLDESLIRFIIKANVTK
jgi:hypothetical protein